MRGDDNQQDGMFSYISPESVFQRITVAADSQDGDEILKEMSPQFQKFIPMWGAIGAPERLLRSLLLQSSIRCTVNEC